MRIGARWIPAVVAPVAIAVVVVAAPGRADSAVDLPDLTAEQVLALAAGSQVTQYSGTLEQTSDLGLPSLPSAGHAPASGAGAALDLLTGSHTVRVYVDAPTGTRIQVMDTLSERDLVRKDREVWYYSSADNTAMHLVLPDGGPGDGHEETALTPEALAERVVEHLDPSTAVSVGPDVEVAGRPAYQVVLEPRTTATLVESATIAVDGRTGLVLAVEIRARDQAEPAFRMAFTDLDLAAPDPALFSFTPPADATVQEVPVPDPAALGTIPPMALLPGMGPSVTGSGWEAVVELPAPGLDAWLSDSPVLDALAVPVEGGWAVSSSLMTVLVTGDGRILAGMVPLDRLLDVADAP